MYAHSRTMVGNTGCGLGAKAPALGAGDRRFESSHPDASIAQWIEQRPSKPWVRGSNPLGREQE